MTAEALSLELLASVLARADAPSSSPWITTGTAPQAALPRRAR